MTNSDEHFLAFLEMAAASAVSGRIIEWPQLRPAIAWVVKDRENLKRELAASCERERALQDRLAALERQIEGNHK